MGQVHCLRLEVAVVVLRRVIHATVYFKRAQGWVGMATFVMVLRLTLIDLGLNLEWWESMALVTLVVVGMVGAGWLEFRYRTVDIEQSMWSEHTPILKRIEQQR